MRFLVVLLVACAGLASAGCRSAPIRALTSADAANESHVRIEGNRAVDDATLIEAAALELEAFRKSRSSKADAADAAWSMERLLQEQGYHEASVAFEVKGQTAIFQVSEGPRALLRGVRLCGVKHLDREKLLEYFDFGGSQFLGLGPVLYDEQLLRDAAEQVEREYRLFGFQDVEVKGPDVTWNDERSCALATFTVVEGPRTCVCDVRVEGVCGCNLGLHGKPFTTRMAPQAVGRVREALLNRGHQFAKVRAEVSRDRSTHCASITIRATPGPKVRLGCVRFRRLGLTDRRFVRSLIPLRSGQVLAQRPIDVGLENLYRAGLFKAVVPEVVPTGPATADMVFDLPEIEAKSIEIEAGYGSYELLRTGLRYLDRNLFGWGRRLEAYGRAHLRGYEVDLSLIDPWIFGRHRQLELDALFEQRKEPSYRFTGLRLRAAVRADVGRHWRLRGGYRFQSERASDVEGEIPGAELDGFVNAAGLFFDAIFDTRDNPALPTAGTVLEAGTFWSSPNLGGDLDFIEFTSRGAYLVPLGDVVLALGATFRTKEILDGATSLPIQERYFLGGDDTIRSFEESELGPTDLQGDPVGGLTAFSVHSELRFPLGIGDLHGAAFYDGGVVNLDTFDFSGPFGHAVGAGLRYYFPFGPIRVDVGYNPGRRFGADDNFAVHLSLGFAF